MKTTSAPTVAELAQAYRDADAAYQLAYAAFLTGSKTHDEMKAAERAKAKAFRKYAKAKKAGLNLL
jgi:hypothetical protein